MTAGLQDRRRSRKRPSRWSTSRARRSRLQIRPEGHREKEIEATKNEPTPPTETPETKPEPKPEPPKPQPKAEAKPEPKKPEPKTDPIAEALKKDDSKKKDEQKQAEAKPVPTPPKKPGRRSRSRNSIRSKTSALLDKRDPQRQAATGETVNRTASLGVPTGSVATLSQSDIDALRAQIRQCWNPPPGALEARN